MKKNILLILIALFLVEADSYAQFSKYIIRLKDKGTNPFSISNPIQYLTQRSIDRRTRYGIAIDSTDLPITPRYIDSIRNAGAVTILNVSKWLNQVAIQTTDAAALTKINSFPFVISTAPLAPKNNLGNKPVNKKLDAESAGLQEPTTTNTTTADYYNYGLSYGQVHLHNGEFLHNRGFRGQGMHMAVLDAGFFNYLTLPTFDSIRNNGQVLGTWDFVTNNANVNEDNSHGTACLSTIAANMPGTFMGTAPKTSFYLYRTEDVGSEYPIEEQNWVAGMERADSLGVEITSTSLGYFTFDNAVFNYTYATDLNGNTTLSAKGADLAAKKGILCVLAAGNEGNSSWHFLITPSDADSVMAVGAVSTSGAVGSFSSYGPSSDGQVKPAVAAVGVSAVVANANTGQPSFGSGTSYACPNMAGLTSCLWQAFPEVNNMRIITVMQESATRANNPDNRVGYGIPDMKKAFVKLVKQLYTQQSSVANCAVNLQWTAKTDSAINIVVERKLPAGNYTTISTHNSTGAFQSRNFNYTDDLRAFPTSGIWYRIKMNVATDTTFYLDSMLINFTPRPNLGADKSASVCSPGTINLTTQFNTAGLTANWTLAGNPVANPAAVSATGAYQLIAANNSGCADTAVVNVTINPKPSLGADQALGICAPVATANLTTVFNTAGLTTSWTIGGNAVANPAAINTPGIYQLVATSGFGCADTATVTVTNNTKPNLGTDKSVEKCTTATIDLTAIFNTAGLTTTWTLAGNAVANPAAAGVAGTYQIIAINSVGCADTATVTVTDNPVLCPGNPITDQITISPNPVKDNLSVKVVRTTSATVGITIHNAAGQMVYNTTAQQAAGQTIYSIPMKRMGSGTYFVTVRINGEKEKVKKIMLK
ncbi:MAG: S8 family peptidase [Ferruginibacter sp.]|nr:S8 family peptidase [Ferruginibacter sp.]